MERKLQGEFGCSPGRLQNTPTKNTVLFLEPWVRKNSDPNDICFTFPSFLEVWDYCLLIFRPHHFCLFPWHDWPAICTFTPACFTTSSNLLIMLKVATTAFRSPKHQFIDCSWVFLLDSKHGMTNVPVRLSSLSVSGCISSLLTMWPLCLDVSSRIRNPQPSQNIIEVGKRVCWKYFRVNAHICIYIYIQTVWIHVKISILAKHM